MRWLLLLLLLFIGQNIWAATGGTPGPNPHPTPGPPNQPIPGPPESPGQPRQPGVQVVTSATVVPSNTVNTQTLTLATQDIVNSANTNQSAITLRGLLLAPRQSFDVWSNYSGVFTQREDLVCINAGIDYRIMPKWVVGLLGNWVMGEHVSGSAMNGGIYTAFSQWGFYLVADEVINREPETYQTYAQTGYILKLGSLVAGPFYSTQYRTKHGLLENQVGCWLTLPALGKLSPEVQVMWENNQKPSIPIRRDLLWVGGALNYEISKGLFLNLGYNFEGNGHVRTNTITGGFKIQW